MSTTDPNQLAGEHLTALGSLRSVIPASELEADELADQIDVHVAHLRQLQKDPNLAPESQALIESAIHPQL